MLPSRSKAREGCHGNPRATIVARLRVRDNRVPEIENIDLQLKLYISTKEMFSWCIISGFDILN